MSYAEQLSKALNPMKIFKICGLKQDAMIDIALAAGAKHLGFVHFPKSPRHLELNLLDKLTSYAGNRAMTWAVLAKPSLELLLELTRKVPSVKGMQVHGDLSSEMMAEVRNIRPDMKFMRAYSIAEKSDLPDAETMAQYDYVLFDAKPKADDKLPGGNGTSFNWDIMQGFDAPVPWFLAGGLNTDNVKQAIEQSGAQMVDVSSGVESAYGVKDPELIKSFVDAALSV